ncbi:P-loop containing nucleoside triphosphate hydrolase [Arabidopsis thaliana x Arabidopsis arenosa]|uniref:Dephospho-CoA kinase n=1 Tax=Arabidopsis thaliana x Arabidopsis arenosa TaxID=1240361 RepID=A0A8T1XKY5_9BRAS|nr:P-loop containing nucleoside triphosphate hydrolase [Arabidopsis thaliana x Arabidopsis arenosa]
MRIVGLTGGIASGKSTVSNLFKASGIPVVDADVVARDVLKKGSGGWKRVVAAFGEEILLPSREVDRPKLGQIVFSSDSKRQLLNKLMAPYISNGIFWEILKQWASGTKVIVVDIPLLFEVKMDKWTKPIVVVWVSQETQLKRLMERDGLSEEDARNRVMAQMSLDSKRSKADVVIDNNGSFDDLHQQFDNVLFEIRKPLTWIEFWRSRQGAFSVLGSVILGLSVCKHLKIGS